MKKISIDVYGQTLLIFESRADFNRWEKRNPINGRTERHREMDTCDGVAGVLVTEDDVAHWFIYLESCNLRTLCHEALHVAYMMLDLVGIEHNVDNHEALAYLTDFIFGECANKMKVPTVFE